MRHDDAAPEQAGRVIAGRYRLLHLLGRGGMGSVWAAEHTQLQTPVAVKLIRAALADGALARARFVREARSAASLRGPNVVQILDYGVEEGTPYIAMERLEGESLAQWLRSEGPLAPADVLSVVAQIGRAIGRAHAAGIIHRDLKPDNVFVRHDEDGLHCKVLDFGIAMGLPGETMDVSTATGAMVGTPYYMSPEQARDAGAADARSDLWSLAVIAYECLVGARPFDADSVPALAVKILIDPIPVPSEHADVPRGFDAWFAQATARDPDARLQSARALTTALASALGLAAPALITLDHDDASAVLPRRSGALAATAAFVAVVVAGAWLAMRESPRESPSAPASAAPPPDAPTPTLTPAVERGRDVGVGTGLVPTPDPVAPLGVESPPSTTPEPSAKTKRSKPTPTAAKPDLGDLEF